MNEKSIRNHFRLEAEQSLESVSVHEQIDSTNSEAIRRIQSGQTGNALIVSNAQSAGRGRRGREWLSPKNSGIYMSLIRSFGQEANTLQALSLVTAISVLEGLRSIGAQGLQLKWPNDVLHEGRKLSGILLEMQQTQRARCIVFGIGINITLAPEAVAKLDRPVTDLASLLAEIPAREILIASIVNSLCENLSLFERDGFSVFEAPWNKADTYRMTEVLIQNGQTRIRGKSLGVDADGALLVQTEDGVESINGGEVFPSLHSLADA